MRARVEIDLNVRVRGNESFVGVENVRSGPVRPGEDVTVFESETGIEGNGRVTEVDHDRGLVYLVVDWSSLGAQHESADEDAAEVDLGEGRALLHDAARRHLGLTGDAFLVVWDMGGFTDPDTLAVQQVAALIPFAR